MDISLLKTFLEVYRTRHFGHAAEHLFITQSAVSARIRQLEETLGVALFTRERNNIQLTPSGTRFLKHAESIVNAWNQACQDTAVAGEAKSPFSLGGMFSLWDIVLQDWIQHLYRQRPDLALRTEALTPEMLVRHVLDGSLDLAFMFEPPQLTELIADELGAVQLVMVSSRAGLTATDAVRQPDYIMVDWGTSFAISHARRFQDMPSPALHMAFGRMALGFLLSCGGVAYLAEPMVNSAVAEGRLYVIADAPRIERRFFAVHSSANPTRRPLLQDTLHSLRHFLAATEGFAPPVTDVAP